MFKKLKNTICDVAVEGIKYVCDNAKNQYPKIKSQTERANQKIYEETIPAINKTHNDISKFIIDKYSEAINLKNKAEQDRKRNWSKILRNSAIITLVGFAAGAATGYVLIKKSEIKESDYVFSDDGEFKNLYNQNQLDNEFANTYYNNQSIQQENCQNNYTQESQKKSYRQFDDFYELSDDGTTLIRK